MFLLVTSYLFLLGVLVGSFLNVVALRWGDRSFLRVFTGGRSACPHCDHALSALELIPLASYIIQHGRCKVCHGSLSLQYPLAELAAGVVFATLYAVLQPGLAYFDIALFALYLIIACVLIVIVLYDVRNLIIPDELVFTFIGLTVPLLFIHPETMTIGMPSLLHVLAGPALFLPFYALWVYSKGAWIGLGDGKLAWGIGWLLGMYAGFSAIIFSFWIGAVVALAVMGIQRGRERADNTLQAHESTHTIVDVVEGRTISGVAVDIGGATDLSSGPTRLTMKSEIPFGPFLIAGTALVFVTGWTLETVVLLIGG